MNFLQNMSSIIEIKAKLNELKYLDKKFEVFGALSHRYEFNERLSIDELIQFEEKYEIHLPEGYKAFLSEIGNGGAGPYYGIHPLQRDLGEFNPQNKFEHLKFNFPHIENWNWNDRVFSKFDELRYSEEEEVSSFFENLYWEQYCKDELTYGSLYLTRKIHLASVKSKEAIGLILASAFW